MLESIYGWIQNTTFYLVIVTAVLEVIPGTGYKKYIRFFSGMVTILLLLTPILRLAGMEETFLDLYHNAAYEQERREMEKQEQYFEEIDLFDFLPEEYQDVPEEDSIEVEEIQIGEEVERNSGTDERE